MSPLTEDAVNLAAARVPWLHQASVCRSEVAYNTTMCKAVEQSSKAKHPILHGMRMKSSVCCAICNTSMLLA